MGEQGREMNVCVCGIGGGGYFFLTPLSDNFSPLSLRRVLQQRVFNSTRKVFSLSSFFSMSSVFYFSQPEQESVGATLDIPAPQLTPPPFLRFRFEEIGEETEKEK